MHTLAVFGFGNMGSAVVAGAVRAGVLAARDVVVVEPDEERRDEAQRLGCAVETDAERAGDAPQLLLAVKPQSFPELAAALARTENAKAEVRRSVVISVMAGPSSPRLREALGGDRAIVRAMPNTPCRVGLGMTALALGAGARPGDEALAERLFGAVGRTVRVEERQLEAITAVSGSGPAYLFLFAELWEDAARELGFDAATAKELVRQTIVGSAKLLEDRAVDAATLRAAVTSKGGTTAAALAVFEERGLRATMLEALRAAERRGRELAG